MPNRKIRARAYGWTISVPGMHHWRREPSFSQCLSHKTIVFPRAQTGCFHAAAQRARRHGGGRQIPLRRGRRRASGGGALPDPASVRPARNREGWGACWRARWPAGNRAAAAQKRCSANASGARHLALGCCRNGPDSARSIRPAPAVCRPLCAVLPVTGGRRGMVHKEEAGKKTWSGDCRTSVGVSGGWQWCTADANGSHKKTKPRKAGLLLVGLQTPAGFGRPCKALIGHGLVPGLHRPGAPVKCTGQGVAAYWAYLRLASASHLSSASPDRESQRSLAAL